MKAIISIAAKLELAEAKAYYKRQSPDLGDRLLQDFRDAVKRIGETPYAGHILAPGIRRRLLTTFPYGVVYNIDEKIITVIAVAHLHREPDYWRDRIG